MVERIIDNAKKYKPEEEIERQYTSSRHFKKGEGLKVMTPNQLLTRLPILLAQKKQEIIAKNETMK